MLAKPTLVPLGDQGTHGVGMDTFVGNRKSREIYTIREHLCILDVGHSYQRVTQIPKMITARTTSVATSSMTGSRPCAIWFRCFWW